MLYVHSDNILNKITANYKNKACELQTFYTNNYLPVRNELASLDYSESNFDAFKKAAKIMSSYYNEIEKFSSINGITSQSKFASTFFEEISNYLFSDLPSIKNHVYDIYNKKIFAGLKINQDGSFGVITKDVDFCIGKEFDISIEDSLSSSTTNTKIIIPIVAVEVKTYLDATMFGEIKSSSKTIRSASPNSKAYVLIGYSDLANEHVIAARQDSTISEIFALQSDKGEPFDPSALFSYWLQVRDDIINSSSIQDVPPVGRLLYPDI